MKRRIGIVSVLLAVLFVVGCSSKPYVYDRSVPLEESSTLKIINCSVLEFDDESKLLSPSWQAHNGGTKEIIIPAGRHSLLLYAEAMHGDELAYAKGPISYDFLPGHTYVVRAIVLISGFKLTRLEATIVDIADMARELVPDPTKADASPFEGTWVSNNGDRLIISGNEYIVFQANKIVPWRGTFSYNSQTVTLNVLYINQPTGWIPFTSLLQRQYVYNGTTLRGQDLTAKGTIEFKMAE